MRTFVDKELTFTFKCNCGSIDFNRQSLSKNLKSFFEGSFECSSCKKEYDYTSKVFKRNYTQTALF